MIFQVYFINHQLTNLIEQLINKNSFINSLLAIRQYHKLYKLAVNINQYNFINSNRIKYMQANKQRRAIPFIIKNEQNNSYQLTKQAEDLLKKVDKNISVVSVAGLYRTGKSYLLNSVILDKKSVFGVGPTVNPCTKGLWLWVEPDPTTQKRSMLVIDTEGLGALDEQANHDMKIFCLAVLLSTTFIYNSVGSIDENALQNLSLVLNIVSSIDAQNISNRPQFIWVVRDFTLQLIDQKGKTLTPQQYLQMALTTNTKQAQKASIRKTITSAFTQRDCYTLVKPLIDETKLQNLDLIPMDQLRPQFVSQSIELRNKIKSTLKQFKLTSNSNNITGKQYLMVVQKYLVAINAGVVPNMVDTWTFIKEQKSREALQQIRRTFTQRIKSKIMNKIPMKRNFIDQQFRIMKAEAKALFLKMTYEQSSTELVQQFMNNAYNQVAKLNIQQNKQHIKSILTKQFQPFLKKLYSQYYNNYEEFQVQVTKNYRDMLIQKYQDRTDDIKQYAERFADQKLIQNFKFFQKKLKEDAKNMKLVKQQLQATLSRQLTQMSSIKQKQRRANQQKLFQLQKKLRIYENEKQQLLQFGKAEKDLLQTNMNFLKKKNQELTANITQLNKQIGLLQHTQNQLKQKNYMEHKQNQKQKALFVQKQDYMNTRIRQIQQKCAQLQDKFNQTGGRFESEKKDIMKNYQDKIDSLEYENKRISEKLMETQTKLGKILDEAKQMSDQLQHVKQNSMTQKKKLQMKIVEAQSSKKISRAQLDLKQQNHELIQELQKANDKFQEANKKLKMFQDQMKNMQNNYQKQIAIHVQQIQFQQIQINDFKNRYEELKHSYQNALQNLHDSSKNQESSMQLKMYELNAEHQKQIKNLEFEHQEKMKPLKKQIQMLHRHKEQMILQQSLEKKNFQTKEKQWKQTLNMFQSMVKKLEQKIQSSQKDHQDINKQKQTFYSLRVKQLQQELEQVKQKASLQVSQNSKKSQQAFAVLKHYSQMQKQQWQKRLLDQKERSEKKLKSLRDQFQKKMSEQKAVLQEQISDLQARLAHLQRVFNQKLQNMQYDHDISMQKITNQYTQQKVQLNKQLALTQQKLEMTRHTFQKELSNKIKYYETTLESTKMVLRQQFQQNMKRLTQQKETLEQKLESIKKSNRQLEQNNLILKSQSDKQKAVYKEKQKTFERKIIQLQNRLQLELGTYNKTIQTINHRHAIQIQKLNEQIDKLNYNVSSLQEQKDRLETQHENNINRLQAKLKVVEQSKNKNKQDYEDIVNKFQCAVAHFGNQQKKFKAEKDKKFEQETQKTSQNVRLMDQRYHKMMKDNDERVARLTTQNKSLKQRIMVIQLERSTSTNKKTFLDEAEKQKLDRKYQKRIQQYKQLYEREKQKSRKLKQQNTRLRMQMESSSFVQGNSTITYCQRPSFSQISNSRLYNGNGTSNNTTQIKRKYTNTPADRTTATQHRGFEDYSGILRFNAGTGYKNNRD